MGFNTTKGKTCFLFSGTIIVGLTDNYGIEKQKTKQEPASSAVGSDGSFLIDAYTRKNVLFAHSTSPLTRVLASQCTDHDKTWRAYAPLS